MLFRSALWEQDRFTLEVHWGMLKLASAELPLANVENLTVCGKVQPFVKQKQCIIADVILKEKQTLVATGT